MFRIAASTVVLAAIALSLPSAASAASGCAAPASGYRSCLHAHWTVVHGDVSGVKARVILVERVARCRGGAGSRRATLERGKHALGSRRAPSTCARGVRRWETTFTRTDTSGWTLRKGDVLRLAWSGTNAVASVTLTR